MRRKYLAILLLVLYGVTVGTMQEACGQSSNRNYIRARTFTDTLGTKCLDEITYFDGLGRPVQTVQKGFTTGGNDLVTYQEYDSFGRKSNTWLPVSVSGNNGAFVSLATINSSAGGSYPGEAKPYSRPVYEASPLSRVLEQYGPGAAWQNNSRSVKTGYFTNISGNDTLNCVYYKVSEMTVATDSIVTVSMNGNYPTGSLLITRITDEDGNASFQFKDHLGQVLLMRQIARNGNAKVLHDTYYVYDGFGNCTTVLPPMAADNLKSGSPWTNATSIVLRNYAYLYMYDSRGRCKGKRLPGCTWSYYIYDKADRLLFSQDGEQRSKSPQEWTFTLPDALGRVCLTGTCRNTYNALAANSPVNMVVKLTRNNNTDAYKGYTLPAGFTLSTPVILSVNYYDDYAFMGKNGIASNTDTNFMYNPEPEFNTRYTTSAKTFLTGTLTSQLLPDGTISATYLCSIMYYDYQGKVIQTKSNNHLVGGIEKEYVAYNFTGQPVKTKHIHSATNKDTQNETYTYTYDHAERITKVQYTLNGSTTTLTNNTYDNLGRLSTKSLHGSVSNKLSYGYNIRNWLTNINATNFKQNLYYNSGNGTALYNGNISSMTWQAGTETVLRGYKFNYDNLSRIATANYGEGSTISTNAGRFSENITEYDKNGNIKSLQRYGKSNSSSYGITDNLTIAYNGNQLKYVNDAATDPLYNGAFNFVNGSSSTSDEYIFDANGNLQQDFNKKITKIQYNLLNLPSTLQFTNGNRTDYIYGADGVKRRVTHQTAIASVSVPMGQITNLTSAQVSQTNTTDYCGNVIYENGSLSKILTEEGYITLSGSTPTYHYYLKDHLGNNRVVMNQSGTVEQVNHYYPFGGLFGEGTATSNQPYKYNGKELDRMHGVDWYDYGARHYDAALGRWHVVDALAEKYYSMSLYTYCGSNPVSRIDPTGNDWFYYSVDGKSDPTWNWHEGNIYNTLNPQLI